jgi:hypothetical protein
MGPFRNDEVTDGTTTTRDGAAIPSPNPGHNHNSDSNVRRSSDGARSVDGAPTRSAPSSDVHVTRGCRHSSNAPGAGVPDCKSPYDLLNVVVSFTKSASQVSRGPIYRRRIAAIRKAGPADSAHDELSWRNFPRLKSHPASRPSAAGPVTGHSGEVSTPEMSTPPRPLKTGADRRGFPNREAIVRKALERFLSVENPISRPLQEVLKPHRLS